MAKSDTLKRSLGMWAIVALGLGYMTPTVVFDTFGIVTKETNGVVPLAYLVALAAMMFTAISYGKMVRVFHSAGSAYTYTRESMHPGLGFMVGWASLMDYLLLPMVNAVIIRIYLHALFPGVPVWIWVIAYVVGVTAINAVSMDSTSRLNFSLVVFEVTLIAAFVVLMWIKLHNGAGQGTIFTLEPLYHSGVEIGGLLTGATIVCFSFIGFDAITMYVEEAKNETAVPRAILWTLVIGGGIFFIGGYFGQAVFPDVSTFHVVDDTIPEMSLQVGGQVFQALFMAGAFAATVASGLASHASVSRMMYVMGRNGVLRPQRLFSFVHHRFHTPMFAVILAGAVSLLAIWPTLELISSVINFGALIAFTFVNLSVIAYFAVRGGRFRTGRDIFSYVIMPLIAAGFTGILWAFLHSQALWAGIIWSAAGLVYLVLLTRGFRRRISDFDLAEADPDAVNEAGPEAVSES